MRTRATYGLAVGIVTLIFASTAFASLREFAGNWKNIDANTGGVTTLDIRVVGSNVTVQAWGKCHPQDCDWGRVNAFAYGSGVSSNVAATAEAISAVFQTGFSQTLVIIRPTRRGYLSAQVLTRFTDSSGRSNYTQTYTFRRGGAVEAAGLLAAPAQVAPANGTTFNRYPRRTTLVWRRVRGARSYTVEIDCYNCCQANKWCTDVGRTWKVESGLRTPRYVFDFVGAQPGRWRVWAVDASGQAGERSGWWEFHYTR